MRVEGRALCRILPVLLFAVYVYLLLYLTLIKRIFYGITSGMFLESYKLDTITYSSYFINFVPFKTVYEYLVHPPTLTVALTNILGNLLAFLPMGFLVPVVFKRLNSLRLIFIVSASSSVLIEIVQFLLRVGSADVDDILLNSVGGLIGFYLYRGFINLLRFIWD